MALNTTNYVFDVDMIPSGFPPVLPASMGDIGRPFVANLYWGGSVWSPASGTTCKVRGKKPDGTVFDYSASISGSKATFFTQEQMTIVDGKVECELVFLNNGTQIACGNFILLVENGTWDPDSPSVSEVTGIQGSSIADGAITKAKLATAVQNQIDGNSTDVSSLKTRVSNIENKVYFTIDANGIVQLGG